MSVVALVDDDGTRCREFQMDRNRITGDIFDQLALHLAASSLIIVVEIGQ